MAPGCVTQRLLAVSLLAIVGCTTEEGGQSQVALPLATGQALPAENSNAIVVEISNGDFDHTLYEEQTGDCYLIVRTSGGPYLFYIDDLVDKRELPEQGETGIYFSVSAPGRHTIHAALSTPTNATASEATATLDVEPVGGR
jgi:hypothetical protein